MPRRPLPEPVSPRAQARLASPRRGFVPTARDLDPVQAHGPARAGARPEARASPKAWGGDVPAVGSEEVGRPARHRRAAVPRRWFRLPAAAVGARWHPGRAAALGVVVVVLLAAAVFGLRVAWARSSGDGTVIAPGGGSRAGPTGVTAGAVSVGVPTGSGASGSPTAGPPGTTPTGPSAGGGAAAATASVLVVHVVGQVRRPGVQRLPVGSRVQDAVRAAGGPTKQADLGRVNLARLLVDGEQVRVPAPGDPDPPTGGVGASSPGGAGTGAGSGAGAAGASGPVSVNTADLAALDTLPGVGPVLAQRILDWRGAHGRFTSVDELGEVSGIGEKLLDRLRPLVTV